MATIILPRSLIALFPAAPRRCDVDAETVAEAIDRLDALAPGMRDRIVDAGPVIREHVKVFVDAVPASLATPLRTDSTVHVIPAVSGGTSSVAPVAGGGIGHQRVGHTPMGY